MSYDAHFRVWRGDAEGGELVDYPVRGERGRGRPRHHPPAAADRGRRPRRPLELQGRQVRFVQRGDQRTAAADVHDADVDLRADRDHHRHPAADLPGDPRPRHRRGVQLHEGPRDPGVRAAAASSRPASTGCSRSTSSGVQEFRKCIECYLCQNTCHVVRDHEENKPAFAGPRYLMRMAELDMHPLDTQATGSEEAQDEHGLGYLQHHQVLHRGLPRAHQDHRQRADPAEGARGRPQVRPAGVAGQQAVQALTRCER